MSKEAMKLALEALEICSVRQEHQWNGLQKISIAKEALKEALAKQEQGEPVGTAGELFTNTALERLDFRPSTKIYTTPQQRTWVGLTNEDDIDWDGTGNLKQLVEAVEAKLKEKNT